jgi:hypothetical protein
MDDRDAPTRRDPAGTARRPWSAPRVILSDEVARGVQVNNKGRFHIPDRKSTSTSTS